MVAGACLASSGCLLPPPIEEGTEVTNRAPRIVLENLSPPPTAGRKLMSTTCLEYRFFAALQDPDPGDTIYWRVFIDYRDDPNPLSSSVVETEPPNETDPTARRAIAFTIDPLDDRFGSEATKFEEHHSVELLISDRPFYADERAPLARAVEPKGLKASSVWPVELTNLNDEACVKPR
jgi:hypothetical protein